LKSLVSSLEKDRYGSMALGKMIEDVTKTGANNLGLRKVE